MKPVIGIVGGRGKTGSQFARFFRKKGFKVLIGSRSGLSYEDCAKKSDIVIISVPIDVAVDTINQISGFVKKDALLADFTSLKTLACRAMLKSKSAVIGIHPMFGPSIKSLRGQTIVICPLRPGKWLDFVKKILKGANLIICRPEYHDKMSAFIQGLMHFHMLALAKTFADMKLAPKDSLKFSTPPFRIELDMFGRMLSQDPKLYADIQIENPSFLKVLNTFEREIKELKNIVKNKDKKKFIEYFNKASRHFEIIKAKSMKESDYVIKKLAERK